jgi:hypothetical protein
MKSTSQCPICKAHFPYRSNKIYCSTQCKNEAFRQGTVKQTDLDLSTDPIITRLTSARGASSDKTSDARTLLKLRRLEFEHQRFLAQLQSEENERNRLLEAKKLETEMGKYQQLQGKVDELRKKLENQDITPHPTVTQSSVPCTPVTIKKVSLKDNPKLWQQYVDIIQLYLDTDGQTCNQNSLELYHDKVDTLIRNVKHWAKKQGVPDKEWKSYHYLLVISDEVERLLEEIEQKSFWDRKVVVLEIAEEWRREMEASLK